MGPQLTAFGSLGLPINGTPRAGVTSSLKLPLNVVIFIVPPSKKATFPPDGPTGTYAICIRSLTQSQMPMEPDPIGGPVVPSALIRNVDINTAMPVSLASVGHVWARSCWADGDAKPVASTNQNPP